MSKADEILEACEDVKPVDEAGPARHVRQAAEGVAETLRRDWGLDDRDVTVKHGRDAVRTGYADDQESSVIISESGPDDWTQWTDWDRKYPGVFFEPYSSFALVAVDDR